MKEEGKEGPVCDAVKQYSPVSLQYAYGASEWKKHDEKLINPERRNKNPLRVSIL